MTTTSLTDIPWGIHFDMPSEKYHALPGASASILKCLWGEGITPAHAKVKIDEGVDETDALVRGTLIHHGILEPGTPMPKIEIEPENYPAPPTHPQVKSGAIEAGSPLKWSNNSKICKAWHAERKASGITVLKAEQYLAVDGAVKSVSAHGTSRAYFEQGNPEVSLVLQDPETKLPVRCRFDWLPDGPYIVDVKSCRHADREQFTRDAYERGYHIQFALYLDLWAALAGASDPRPRMKVVAVETSPPYAVNCFDCEDSMIDRGRRTYRKLLNILARCLATGEWPAYPEGESVLGTPRFKFSNDWSE